MDTLANLKTELHQEYVTTKKFIENFPEGKNDYTPHEKSFKMMPLAVHIVEIFAWPAVILSTSELDFGKNEYKPTILNTKTELMKKLDDDFSAGKAALEKASEADLNPTWALKMSGQTLNEWSKYGAIRHALNQITHHRAQLGVYYRLNNIPLPGSYGPSADDQKF
jgi:uncharacterized damage-inducible protein DinB